LGNGIVKLHAYELTSFTKFDSSISSPEDFIYFAQKRADHVVGMERQKMCTEFWWETCSKMATWNTRKEMV
jgi:hypothetical protein